MRTIPVRSAEEAGRIAAALIATRAANGPLRIALPGGRSVVPVYDSLSAYPASILENLSVRIGDERIFGEKNETVIREHLVKPAADRGASIELRAPLSSGSRDGIVASYEETIEAVFDAVLLGVGEDGHVLGLYPHFPQLDSERMVESFDDSPKPPPERMTTTLRCYDPEKTLAILLFLGVGKREALEAFRKEPDYHDLPAAYFARFAHAYVITDQL